MHVFSLFIQLFLAWHRRDRCRPVPELDSQDINQPQAQLSEPLEILPCSAINQHALHVILQLGLAVHAVERRDNDIPSSQVVDDTIK